MSSEDEIWLSATELSMLGEQSIAQLPHSRQGVKFRAKSEGWNSREVKGSGGPLGIRIEYRPPDDVLVQIRAFLDANPEFLKKKRGELPPAPARSPVQAVTPPAPYSLSPGTGEQLDQRLAWAEATIRLAYIVRSYPKFAKVSGDLLQRVSLLAFRLVFLFCDGDLKRINQWLDDGRKADGIVRMAYEGDCIKRGVVPGADLDI